MDLELHQLDGQVEVALEVGAVDDVHHDVRPLVDEEAAGHALLVAVGMQAVGAG